MKKQDVIDQILDDIASRSESVGMSMWSEGPSDGGYLIRQDGSVFAIGEFQEVAYQAYGTLADLSLKELSRVYGNLMESQDYIQDLMSYDMQFSDPASIRVWVQEPVTAASKPGSKSKAKP